jgi:GNAT superfamily N-acetyltransferase
MLMTDIHVRAFVGPALKAYLHSIAKLRIDVFREYPFLEEPDLRRETEELKRYLTSKAAIGVLVFDNTTLIGVSLGIPLNLAQKEIQKPFLDRFQDISTYFYFGESVLLKQYRSRGIGHHFFDVRETHVRNLKQYRHICFFDPARAEMDSQKPADFLSLHDFWRKRGYVHCPDLRCTLTWRDLHKEMETEKSLSFWVKDLHEDYPLPDKSNESKNGLSCNSFSKEGG